MFVRLWFLVDKRALLVTAACLVAWRVLNEVPVFAVTSAFIDARLGLDAAPGFLGAMGPSSTFLDAYSLNYYGIGPYVQVMVLVSVAYILSQRLRALMNTPDGRLRIERWMRAAAVLLALGFAWGWVNLAQNAGAVPDGIGWFARLCICLQMAAGTAVMIFLAGALDEHGLGFGYGAVIFYALDIFALGWHRFAGVLASAPSLEALYHPLEVWALFSLAIAVAGMAILLASRRVWTRGHGDGEDEHEPYAIDLKVAMPGVLRPGLIAFALLNGVLGAAGYYANHLPALAWFFDNWTPFGSSALAGVYVATEAVLLIGFAIFVVAMDWLVTELPWDIEKHGIRLAAITGLAFALLIAVARPASFHATLAAGQSLPVSGFNILLVVAMVLAVILCIEGRRHPFVTTEALLP